MAEPMQGDLGMCSLASLGGEAPTVVGLAGAAEGASDQGIATDVGLHQAQWNERRRRAAQPGEEGPTRVPRRCVVGAQRREANAQGLLQRRALLRFVPTVVPLCEQIAEESAKVDHVLLCVLLSHPSWWRRHRDRRWASAKLPPVSLPQAAQDEGREQRGGCRDGKGVARVEVAQAPQDTRPDHAPERLGHLLHGHHLPAVAVVGQRRGDGGDGTARNGLAHVHDPRPRQRQPHFRHEGQHDFPARYQHQAHRRASHLAHHALQRAGDPKVRAEEDNGTHTDHEADVEGVEAVDLQRKDAVEGEDRREGEAPQELHEADRPHGHGDWLVLHRQHADRVPGRLLLLPHEDRALRQVCKGEEARNKAQHAIDLYRHVQSEAREAAAKARAECERCGVAAHDVAEVLAADTFGRDVGDVNVGRAAHRAAHTADDAAEDEQPEVRGQALRPRAKGGPKEGQHQDSPPADVVGQPAEDRQTYDLRNREGTEKDAHICIRDLECLCIEGEHGRRDRPAQGVDENCEADHPEGGRGHLEPAIGAVPALPVEEGLPTRRHCCPARGIPT
mmetsp:Transcript_115950/g.322904  ORF Transcript_115950/g.322904 Transcript_115950/m.322904 type:complete len:561 (-) Transcript_115950:3-1685(-)